MRGLKRDRVMQVSGLSGCENFSKVRLVLAGFGQKTSTDCTVSETLKFHSVKLQR